MTNLGILKGDIDTHAYALNDLSPVQVVGTSSTARPDHALLLQNGMVIDLNTQIPSNSGWTALNAAYGINDARQIVGYGQISSGQIFHAFLLTPTTKPALIATSTATAPAAATLGQASLAPLLTEALEPSATAGIATDSQIGVQVPITDLSGALLGDAVSQTIYLDANAAGWGWFVDSTLTSVHYARHSGRARPD
jgi:probable HAF family extracellular repeat protein